MSSYSRSAGQILFVFIKSIKIPLAATMLVLLFSACGGSGKLPEEAETALRDKVTRDMESYTSSYLDNYEIVEVQKVKEFSGWGNNPPPEAFCAIVDGEISDPEQYRRNYAVDTRRGYIVSRRGVQWTAGLITTTQWGRLGCSIEY